MKYYIEDFCCLCLSITSEKFSESPNNSDNLTPYDKIKTVFLELSTVMESDSRICLKCREVVDSIYKFNKSCLKNINILNSYKNVLKENQAKNQCDLFINLNESRQFKVKIEPAEPPVSDDDMMCGTDFILDSHFNGAEGIKEEIEVNFESNYKEAETSCLDSGIKIKLEEINEEKVWINEMAEASEDNQSKPNVEGIKNISVPLTEEVFVKEEENLKLLEDPPLEVIEENSHENQETFTQKDHLTSIHTGRKPHKLLTQQLLKHKNKTVHKCEICEKSFWQKQNLEIHMLIHTGEKPYKCEICGYLFRQKGSLNKHMVVHTGEKPHKCDICGKSFSQNYHLKLHMFIHTGEKPHKCNFCEKKFATTHDLKRHSLVHTGERPYKCDICEMTFTYSSAHKKHVLRHATKKPLLTHTDEKPYKCDICEKSFALKKQLKVHMVVHTGEKSHKCNICEKFFTHKSHLKRHMNTHTGEKPFKCDICVKSFRDPSTLKHHRTIHTVEKPNEDIVSSF